MGSIGRVISNRQPPVKLAPVREAPGSSPGNGGAPKPRRTRQAPVPGRDTLSVPLRGGLSGNGMLPVFFAASVAPQSGRVGNETMPFFLQRFSMKRQSWISDLAPNSSHSTHSFIKNGPLSQLIRSDE